MLTELGVDPSCWHDLLRHGRGFETRGLKGLCQNPLVPLLHLIFGIFHASGKVVNSLLAPIALIASGDRSSPVRE